MHQELQVRPRSPLIRPLFVHSIIGTGNRSPRWFCARQAGRCLSPLRSVRPRSFRLRCSFSGWQRRCSRGPQAAATCSCPPTRCRQSGAWPGTPIRDTSCCRHPPTAVPCLRLGPCLRPGPRRARSLFQLCLDRIHTVAQPDSRSSAAVIEASARLGIARASAIEQLGRLCRVDAGPAAASSTATELEMWLACR